VLDTSRWLLGTRRWAHQGSTRVGQEPVADPALIRALEVGQAAYIYRGGVTFIQVKRLVAGPAALAGVRRAAPFQGPVPAATPAHAVLAAAAGRSGPVPRRPDVSALLDEAFGPEPPR
jgi:hypothetical protein